mgnify:CR=1 FL=1
MSGTRQPVDLVILKGSKHLTQEEIEQRRKEEVKAPAPKQLRAPKYLTGEAKKEFNSIAKQLLEIGIVSKLDTDTLARYVLSQQQYLAATKEAMAALAKKEVGAAGDWSAVQDRYFKQARNTASDLGLTVTSRCRLVIPKPPEAKQQNDPMLRLLEQRRA